MSNKQRGLLNQKKRWNQLKSDGYQQEDLLCWFFPRPWVGSNRAVKKVRKKMPGKIMNTIRILLSNISWIYPVRSILLPLSWSKPPFSLQWTSCHGLPVGLPAWIQQEMISSYCKSGHSDLLYFLMRPARPCNGPAAQWFSISEVFPPGGLWQYLETFLVIPLGHIVGV